MTTHLPCLCQHPYHEGDCLGGGDTCKCTDYRPDDHKYPMGLGWVTT